VPFSYGSRTAPSVLSLAAAPLTTSAGLERSGFDQKREITLIFFGTRIGTAQNETGRIARYHTGRWP